MNPQRKKSAALFNLARRAPAPPQSPMESAPPGFATRIAAQWAGEKPSLSVAELWERICWFGVGASVVVCLLAATLRPLTPPASSLDLLLAVPSRPTTLF